MPRIIGKCELSLFLLVIILRRLSSEHQEKQWLSLVQEKMSLQTLGRGAGVPCARSQLREDFFQRIVSDPVVSWPFQAEAHLLQAQRLESLNWFRFFLAESVELRT